MTTVLLAVGLLGVALLAHRLLAHPREVPRGVRGDGAAGEVSIIVPARDEAGTLPALLRSLRELTTPAAGVLVVDDGSRDGTANVARSEGASVISIAGPPPGWTGKAWACDVGVRSSTGRMLLFLDADTVLAPDALDGLLRLHDQHGGLVSVQPFHRVVRGYEQLSAYFNLVSLLASGAFGPRPPRRAMAFGPCLLTSRVDYWRAGGHAAGGGEILDDVQLAAGYHRAGLSVTCAVGGRSVSMRMYPGGLAQLAEGWTKNFVSGASAAGSGPALTAALWVAAHHAVAVGALSAMVQFAAGWQVPLTAGHPALWTLAWVGSAWQLRSMLRRIGSFRWWTWAAFPLPLLAFDALFARSAALTLVRRSVRWRGRDVPLRHSASGAGGA